MSIVHTSRRSDLERTYSAHDLSAVLGKHNTLPYLGDQSSVGDALWSRVYTPYHDCIPRFAMLNDCSLDRNADGLPILVTVQLDVSWLMFVNM